MPNTSRRGSDGRTIRWVQVALALIGVVNVLVWATGPARFEAQQLVFLGLALYVLRMAAQPQTTALWRALATHSSSAPER